MAGVLVSGCVAHGPKSIPWVARCKLHPSGNDKWISSEMPYAWSGDSQ
jgi:hypothetical protein